MGVGVHRRRPDRSKGRSGVVGLTGVKRARTGLDPEWREIAIRRSSRRSKDRWGGPGAGAVKATGSYEGSLTVEGIPDRHEPRVVTDTWSRRSRRLPHDGASDEVFRPAGIQANRAKANAKDDEGRPASREEEGATGVSEVRSLSSNVGRKRPRPAPARDVRNGPPKRSRVA